MSTDTLERVEEDTKTRPIVDDGGEHDRFAHYFKKSDLEKAFFDGVKIQALCGKWDVPTRDFTKYPVCPTCKEIWEGLPLPPQE